MRSRLAVVASAALIASLMLVPTASAKWALGNGPADLDIAHAPGSTGFSVCARHVHGRAGLHTQVNPSVTPPPSGPYSPLHIDLYVGKPGTLDGAQDIPGDPGGMLLINGKVIHPKVSLVTAAPKALNPPEKYKGFGGPYWEYAATPFSFDLPRGTLGIGNFILIRQSGGPYLTAAIVACNLQFWQGKTWGTGSVGDASITQTDQKLTFDLGTGGSDDPLANYFTDCTLSNAFDARVNYQLNTWPGANSTRVGLLVNNPGYPTNDKSVTAERTSYGPNDVGSGENYVVNGGDSGGGFINVPTNAKSGTLRVSKQGSVLTMSFKDSTTGGQFQEIAQIPAYHKPVSLGLQVWALHSELPGPVKVSFSKFMVTKGVCV